MATNINNKVTWPSSSSVSSVSSRTTENPGAATGTGLNAGKRVEWPCSLCKFKTVRFAVLNCHYEECHKTYPCEKCEFEAETQEALTEHVEVDHNRLHGCLQCEYRTKDAMHLQHHVDYVHKNKGFQRETAVNELFGCDECGQKYIKLIYLEAHKNEVHPVNANPGGRLSFPVSPIESPKTPQVACNFLGCHYKGTQRANVARHTQFMHQSGKESVYNEDETFTCIVCNFHTDNKVVINKHIKTAHNDQHPEVDEENNEAAFRRNTKNATTKRKLSTVAAAKDEVEVNEKKHKCGACPFRTNWASSLRKHIQRQHAEDQEEDPESEPATEAEDDVSVGEPQAKTVRIECPVIGCGYNSCYKKSLETHVLKMHAFRNEQSDSNTISCTEDDDDKGNREQGVKEVIFRCEEEGCSYASKYKANLKKHVKSNHPIYPCTLCDYETTKKEFLECHLAEEHKQVNDDEEEEEEDEEVESDPKRGSEDGDEVVQGGDLNIVKEEPLI